MHWERVEGTRVLEEQEVLLACRLRSSGAACLADATPTGFEGFGGIFWDVPASATPRK